MSRHLRVRRVKTKLKFAGQLARARARALFDGDLEAPYREGIVDAQVETTVTRPDDGDIYHIIVLGLQGSKQGL